MCVNMDLSNGLKVESYHVYKKMNFYNNNKNEKQI